MKLLVTAGNTQAPIDRVRCLTNVFTGRTGAAIALAARRRGHQVTLLTSHPETVAGQDVAAEPYRTFDELRAAMADRIGPDRPDVVFHCAAVSDYLIDGAYGAADGTAFDPATHRWHVETTPALTAGKIK